MDTRTEDVLGGSKISDDEMTDDGEGESEGEGSSKRPRLLRY